MSVDGPVEMKVVVYSSVIPPFPVVYCRHIESQPAPAASRSGGWLRVPLTREATSTELFSNDLNNSKKQYSPHPFYTANCPPQTANRFFPPPGPRLPAPVVVHLIIFLPNTRTNRAIMKAPIASSILPYRCYLSSSPKSSILSSGTYSCNLGA
jgi:hypothetical protein